ncbi:hypothetical protein IU453_26915 [Nocardia cyriacigeorgica]|uniref:hypothetical protein n=1 Tax=Nocardia cyriacigeorgica TaxID=135487 RepID=UPI001894E79C|nr:hypothetical protein [Nocardia cyriacigeorgica]MBF6320387.1 hypothetical protein [Nocardia cyriacigeorgica]MBF6534127.1 hypothetical protein [Nocardia cyriacigeorgica]
MSGDPVEESSQAVRQGFVQALQTAHTTAALMQRRGGETRSRAEHNQRMSNDAARAKRSQAEYEMRVLDAIDKAYQGRELHAARVEEVRKRIEQGGELHKKDLEYKNDQIARGHADLDRRNTSEVLERGRLDAVHDKRIEGYTAREQRAAELHELDVEYKKLLIDIRSRAAGFSDTLTSTGEAGEAMASAAAFATAQAASDLSDTHRDDAAAYAERLVEDSGIDPQVLFDEALTNLAPRWQPQPSRADSLRNILNALTDEMTWVVHLAHNAPDAPTTSPAPATPGEVIDAIVLATEYDPDPTGPDATPNTGLDPNDADPAPEVPTVLPPMLELEP